MRERVGAQKHFLILSYTAASVDAVTFYSTLMNLHGLVFKGLFSIFHSNKVSRHLEVRNRMLKHKDFWGGTFNKET